MVPVRGSRARRIGLLLALVLALSAAGLAPAAATETDPPPQYAYGDPVQYSMIFPVGGADVTYADDDLLGFGACRSGCSRRHEGVDILAPKLTPVYAVAAATVSWVGTYCCSLGLQHDDGWRSWYIHLNNDTEGTDDGQGWGIAEGIVPGARVTAGQLIGWVGDSGNAEASPPHLHFELHAPGGIKVDPYPSLVLAQTGQACTPQRPAPLEALMAEGPALRLGTAGQAVQDLQAFLRVRGYRVGLVDGVFGSGTDLAVRAFQGRQGLEADGVVGPATRSVIAGFIASTGFVSLTDLGGPILGLSDRGLDVRELKRWLRAAGYDPGPRPYSSTFDEVTEAAVRAFQEAQQVGADGMVGPLTRGALLAVLAITGPEVCR